MYGKSKKSSKAIDRPFARDIVKRAEEIARQYQMVIWFEDGEYYGRGVEYPEAMGDGKNPDACVASVRQSMIVGVAHMLERKQSPPPPAEEGVRRQQINIRISDEEKLRLETSARQKGFKGVSDYVRAKALE
jgi:hypothetical protein